ncbi:MAG TPA: serine hydrolase [Blastocatellia bacterium]|nr:serine hydrolase [Blastocatellia bacterium]
MKSGLSSLLIFALTFAASARPGSRTSAVEGASQTGDSRIARLEQRLDSIRQELKIPAMSAAIVKDQKVVWAKGFGYADVENKVAATEHTSYHLASLTKTYASTILMQLVQQGKVKLDDPASKYGITLESEGVIRVKHLFSHTSEGNPGEQYRYNGNRFAELDKVIQKATGKSFAELLTANILDPLAMSETAPNVPPVVKTRSPNGADPKAEGEVKAALAGFIAGLNSDKAEQVEQYLAPQQNAFRGDKGPLGFFLDPEKFRSDSRAGVRLNFQVHNLETAIYGDAALSTCFMSGVVTLPGGNTRRDGPWRLSLVWNKQGGGWKIVHAHQSESDGAIITEDQQQRFAAVSKNLAQPYALDNKFNVVKSKYPTHFSVSAGLISSVLDMAKYDIAIDQNRFLTRETQQLAFTPAVSTRGESLPYGLGWFTQNFNNTRFIWHYGYWVCNSSLILKVPDHNITFIAMANTDNLSRPTDLGAGDVMSSPVGLAFLKEFILPETFKEQPPEINWQAPATELEQQLKAALSKPYADLYKKELLNHVRMYSSVGRADDSTRLVKVYSALYSKGLPDDLAKASALAQIVRVADKADETIEFNLPRAQNVRVFSIGEGQGDEMFDYGWIESAETGKVVWQMKARETLPAGGAGKNRKADVIVALPAGRYKLRYKSDDSHSFDRWNSLPPDINFWGIALYAKE